MFVFVVFFAAAVVYNPIILKPCMQRGVLEFRNYYWAVTYQLKLLDPVKSVQTRLFP